MGIDVLLREFNSLPANLQTQALDFILFLKNSKTLARTHPPKASSNLRHKRPKAGFGKYKVVMSADFDAPLEEFNAYM